MCARQEVGAAPLTTAAAQGGDDGKRDGQAPASLGNQAVFLAFMKLSSVTTHSSRTPNPDGSPVGPGAVRVTRKTLACPWVEFNRFFPIGSIPSLTLACTAHMEGLTASPYDVATTYTITYEGEDAVRTDAGTFPAKRIRVASDTRNSIGNSTL